MEETAKLHLLGIRHHGPGSSRAVIHALEAIQPDALLIEGPVEADGVLDFLANDTMQPPVALICYLAVEPTRSHFFPFASFSPEWNALKYGLQKKIPTHFMDIPQSVLLHTENEKFWKAHTRRSDGMHELAIAASFPDGETLWEHLIEKRPDAPTVFQEIETLMTAMRKDQTEDPLTEVREAYMRLKIKDLQKKGYKSIAVVCGAWHVPALRLERTKKDDQEKVKGLKSSKVLTAWTPWSYPKLSFSSGYKAGVVAPYWYELQFEHANNAVERWFSEAASLLRDRGHSGSMAHIISSVETARALALLRNTPSPGVTELLEASGAVLCEGNEDLKSLLFQELLIGNQVGQVPSDAPGLPLQKDFHANCKSLRIPLKPTPQPQELDLRKEHHIAKSVFLHRVLLSGITVGKSSSFEGGKGSYHEHWVVQFHPEHEIQLIEASLWGNTIREAASQRVLNQMKEINSFRELGELILHVFLADLPEVMVPFMRHIRNTVGMATDYAYLMQLIPYFSSLLQYEVLRKTDHRLLKKFLTQLLFRLFPGLSDHLLEASEEASMKLLEDLKPLHRGIRHIDSLSVNEHWNRIMLQATEVGVSKNGLLPGYFSRILFDIGLLTLEQMQVKLQHVFSIKEDPLKSAHFLQGFLDSPVSVLLYYQELFDLVTEWVRNLEEETFKNQLPILRRTFASFSSHEHHLILSRIQSKKTEDIHWRFIADQSLLSSVDFSKWTKLL